MRTEMTGAPADGAGAPAVELRGITKRYGSIVACDNVSLTVPTGEIHGLLGQNGAGKSTLVKVLLGLAARDAGQILLNGRSVEIPDPLAAAELGIGMVHQHFSLVDELTVWENVTLGEPGRPAPDRTRELVRSIGERYGLDVDPDVRVEDLSTGERQRVEIIKCLRRDPNLLILDEPTSVLTLAESRELFEVLRRVGAGGGPHGHPHQPQARRDPQRDRPRHDHAVGAGRRAAHDERDRRARAGARDGRARAVQVGRGLRARRPRRARRPLPVHRRRDAQPDRGDRRGGVPHPAPPDGRATQPGRPAAAAGALPRAARRRDHRAGRDRGQRPAGPGLRAVEPDRTGLGNRGDGRPGPARRAGPV